MKPENPAFLFWRKAGFCHCIQTCWYAAVLIDIIYCLIVRRDCFIMVYVYCRGVNKEDEYVQEDFSKYACGMHVVW